MIKLPNRSNYNGLFNCPFWVVRLLFWTGFVYVIVLSIIPQTRTFGILGVGIAMIVVSNIIKRAYFGAFLNAFMFCGFYVILFEFNRNMAVIFSFVIFLLLVILSIVVFILKKKKENTITQL